ncbi:MAG: hypothetical protein JWP14_1316 [Frankiales bacterium]|nr:hypothetical protein [Frankiales bacterium]
MPNDGTGVGVRVAAGVSVDVAAGVAVGALLTDEVAPPQAAARATARQGASRRWVIMARDGSPRPTPAAPYVVGVRYPAKDELSRHPRDRVAILVREDGETQTALACEEVLLGESDPPLCLWIGGRHAATRIEGPWPRTWALRAFLYCWDDQVGAAVIDAVGDEAWRVREMAAKVVVRRELAASHLLEPLLADPLPRVRVAGLRALGAVGEAENAVAVQAALADPDAEVARAAEAALARLERRLDRSHRR